jgi:polyhydroxybutyrate depolymerase
MASGSASYDGRWLSIPAIVAGASLLVCACMPRLPDPWMTGRTGTFRVSTDIRTGRFKRDYHLHIPPGYDATRSLPLVVVVHGAFDNAKGMAKFTGFNALADRENFLVLYPNGIGILGYLQHWNAGHCCGKAQAEAIDDVGFVAAAIEDAASRLNVNRRRIFMLGFSNGGMFAYRFAAERGEMLAGFAVLAASMGSRTPETEAEWQLPEPPRPIPLLIMHGTDDHSVPFHGKQSQRRGRPRYYQSVAQSVAFWRSRNGCGDAEPPRLLFNGAVRLTKWSNCADHSAVWLYVLQNWGHVWPGPYFTDSLEDRHPLKGFDAAKIIWDFFKQQSDTPGVGEGGP